MAVLESRTPPALAPLLLGPATQERVCRVLEQQLGALWMAVLESHGVDLSAGWHVQIEGLAVVPGPPPAPPAARSGNGVVTLGAQGEQGA